MGAEAAPAPGARRTVPYGAASAAAGSALLCAVAFLAGLQALPMPPLASPLSSGAQWRPIYAFAGRTIRRTPIIDLQSRRWRIRWTVRPRTGVSETLLFMRVSREGHAGFDIATSLDADRAQQPPLAVRAAGSRPLGSARRDRTEAGAVTLYGAVPCTITVFSHHNWSIAVEECEW